MKLKKYEIDALTNTIVEALVKKAKEAKVPESKVGEAESIVTMVHHIRTLQDQIKELEKKVLTLEDRATKYTTLSYSSPDYDSVEAYLKALLKKKITDLTDRYSSHHVVNKIQDRLITANLKTDSDISALIEALIEEFSPNVE